jgi:hypothetical protein
VFSSEDQRLSASSGNKIPVIAAKKYLYLTPGLEGIVSSGYHDFEFVKDENGYDSAHVTIIDSTGKKIDVLYSSGVAAQLEAAGCASGIITIQESTIYGDSTEYEAIFIADSVNTTTATISYYKDGQKHSVPVAQDIPFAKLEVNAFSFESLKDELDPMAVVKIIHNGTQKLYTFEEAEKNIWNAVGEYSVVFINRLGYSYQIELSIKEPHFTNISFNGEGTDDLAPIVVSNGQSSIILPVISRYGYELLGYEDEFGNIYKGSIEKLNSDMDIVLSPIWQPKTIVLTIKDQNGNVIQTIPLEFGSEYLLIKPILSNGSKFIGWLMNGETLTSDYITVTSEEDIEVVANIEFSGDEDNKQNEENNNSSGCRSLINHWWSGGFIFVVLILLCKHKEKAIKKIGDDHENS